MPRSPLDALFPGERAVLLDGAMGTALRARGWPNAKNTVLANQEAAELVLEVHRAQLAAGAELIVSNSFAALDLPAESGLKAVACAVQLARQAAGERARVAGCVAAFDLAQRASPLKHILQALLDAGIDMLLFETCNRVQDAQIALELCAQLAPTLPCVISASSTDGSRADHARVHAVIATVLEPANVGVEAGLNCCRGPQETLELMSEHGPLLRWLKPSTGVDGQSASASEMGCFAHDAHAAGARFLGGCCGTNAEHLARMGDALGRS